MRLEEESGARAIWYPIGEQPTIAVSRAKNAISYYGALNVKTGKCHLMKTAWQTAEVSVKFLEHIRRYYIVRQKKKKVILIWDGAPWHRGKVREYLVGQHWLELIMLPPYSPDLNPQEHVWKDGRFNVTHNFIGSLEDKAQAFESYVRGHYFSTNFLEKYLATS